MTDNYNTNTFTHALWHARRFALLLLVAAAAAGSATAQSIRGKVIDSRTHEAIIGAVVSVKDASSLGASTDIDGNFRLSGISTYPSTLTVSYTGYKDSEIELYEPTDESIEITLRESFNSLDEVVVLGYQQLKRKDVTGAVSQVSGKEIEAIAAASLTEKLQGQAPGVLIQASSGTPGSAVTVRLRGTTSINAGNDPLYIVDGVPVNSGSLQGLSQGSQTTNGIADINPDDIENIEVLKDAASTAIYGARGANGVILITTKHGKRNRKTQVNLKAEIGWAKAQRLWDILDGKTTAALLNEQLRNDGLAPKYDEDTPNNFILQDAAFRTAALHNYGASVTGGNQRTNFYVGADYTNQEAIIETQDYRRVGLRFNLDHDINKRLTLSTSNSLSHTRRTLTKVGDGPTSLLQPSVQNNPLNNPFNPDGSYAYYGTFENFYAVKDHSDNHAYGLRTINNVSLTWKILPGLQFKTSTSLDYNIYKEKRYFDTFMKEGVSSNGQASNYNTSLYTITTEQLLNYNKTFRDIHTLAAFFGNSVQYTGRERLQLEASDFPSNQLRQFSSAAVTTSSTSKTSHSLVSWFGGANYSLLDRYNLEFNLRADASSRFGSANRWGYFPSFGASWRISKEKFLHGARWLSDLKLKASLGWTGNQEIDDFASLGLWSGGGAYNGQSGLVQTQLANPDLKWETTRQFNVGFEASLLADRLTLGFDYYSKYTTDLLLEATIPGKTGFSSIYNNVGEMSNRGVEFYLTSRNIWKKNFQWTTRFNISHNSNTIEKLVTPITQYNRDWVRLEEGSPLYSFWTYKELYVDPQTGNAVYEDVNGDGKITTADRQICGDAWPDFTGSLVNEFKYKGFDLSLNFYFSVGNDVLNLWRFFMEHGGVYGSNRSLLASQLDRWQQSGDIATLPRLTTSTNADGGKNYGFQSSRYIENGSFLRLRSLSFGYTLPKAIVRRAALENARVYLNITNVFTITKYSGADPEGNVGADGYTSIQGLDFGLPPQPRQFILGVNLTF